MSGEKTCLTIFLLLCRHISVFGSQTLSMTVGLRSSQLLIIAPYAVAICIGVTNNPNPKLLFKNLAVDTVLTDSTYHSSSHASSMFVRDQNQSLSK